VRGQGQRPCREIINIISKLCMYTAVKERRGEGAKDQISGGRRKCVCVCVVSAKSERVRHPFELN